MVDLGRLHPQEGGHATCAGIQASLDLKYLTIAFFIKKKHLRNHFDGITSVVEVLMACDLQK